MADEEDDDVPNVESPSPALEIEGVVNGDPENDQLQSEGGGFTEDNNKVRFPIYRILVKSIYLKKKTK